MHVKVIQKEEFKKPQKQPVISFVIKLSKKLKRSQKIHHRIVQIEMKQLQMKHKILELIEKYLKKIHFSRNQTAHY